MNTNFLIIEESLEELLFEGLKKQNQMETCTNTCKASAGSSKLNLTLNFYSLSKLQFANNYQTENHYLVPSKKFDQISRITNGRYMQQQRKRTREEGKYFFFCNENDKALIENIRKKTKRRSWDSFVSTFTFR